MSQLKNIRLPVSANLKLALVLLALVIVGSTLLYTQSLVSDLQRGERQSAKFYASFIQLYFNTDSASADLSELYHELMVRHTVNFPLILTSSDKSLAPVIGDDGDTTYDALNVDIDTTSPAWMQRGELEEILRSMAATYDPLPIHFKMPDGSTAVSNYLYYGDSEVVQRLRWLPYAIVLLGSMFILVGYLSFSHIKRNEQSNIWVGMAKETAHQLGTPLSSLMGWIELLKMMPEDSGQVIEAAEEMERDVERLNKVAQRFSKIGASAELKTVDVTELLERIVVYFDRRLPHLGKRVSLTMDADAPVYVSINVHLFEWVIENLVRNAVDAIDRTDGVITIRARQIRNQAVIDVSDNGKGIDPKVRKDIFRPGFSTKKRGWGLGLSLARRIVEEYHGGKITLRDSSPAGTTFRVRLDAVPPPPPSPAEQPGVEAPSSETGDQSR